MSVQLIPRNTLMGLENEAQELIVKEALGPNPSIPLQVFSDMDVFMESPLAPFLAHTELLDLALEYCFRKANFTISFEELKDYACVPPTTQQEYYRNNGGIFSTCNDPELLGQIKYLRITDTRPLEYNWLHDDTGIFQDMDEKVDRLNDLEGHFPGLLRFDIYIIPDFVDLMDLQDSTASDLIGEMEHYHANLRGHTNSVYWLHQVPELRIVSLNALIPFNFSPILKVEDAENAKDRDYDGYQRYVEVPSIVASHARYRAEILEPIIKQWECEEPTRSWSIPDDVVWWMGWKEFGQEPLLAAVSWKKQHSPRRRRFNYSDSQDDEDDGYSYGSGGPYDEYDSGDEGVSQDDDEGVSQDGDEEYLEDGNEGDSQDSDDMEDSD